MNKYSNVKWLSDGENGYHYGVVISGVENGHVLVAVGELSDVVVEHHTVIYCPVKGLILCEPSNDTLTVTQELHYDKRSGLMVDEQGKMVEQPVNIVAEGGVPQGFVTKQPAVIEKGVVTSKDLKKSVNDKTPQVKTNEEVKKAGVPITHPVTPIVKVNPIIVPKVTTAI